jgi:hypothetical protein
MLDKKMTVKTYQTENIFIARIFVHLSDKSYYVIKITTAPALPNPNLVGPSVEFFYKDYEAKDEERIDIVTDEEVFIANLALQVERPFDLIQHVSDSIHRTHNQRFSVQSLFDRLREECYAHYMQLVREYEDNYRIRMQKKIEIDDFKDLMRRFGIFNRRYF